MERTSCQGLLVRLKGEKWNHTSVQLVWGTGGPVLYIHLGLNLASLDVVELHQPPLRRPCFICITSVSNWEHQLQDRVLFFLRGVQSRIVVLPPGV